MTVIDPNITAHDITIIPRFYPVTEVVVSLFNESSQVTATPTATYSIANGFMVVSFTFTFADKDKHQIKITEGTEVVYRGKTITTTQDPQDYKLTDGVYLYS